MGKLDSAHLAIGEVSSRTAIPVATLRMWETRYGFPAPRRAHGRHRRYSESDCRMLEAVKAARARGMTLAEAITAARAAVDRAESSILAGVRFRHPGLPCVSLPQPFMLAVSEAIEGAVRLHPEGVVVGAFQRRRAWEAAAERWHAIAERAHTTIAFVDVPAPVHDDGLWVVPLRRMPAMAREWAVVCDAPGWSGCLVGRETTTAETRLRRRVFDTTWSLEPEVARDAARVAIALAAREIPDVAEAAAARLQVQPVVGTTTLREATLLTNRIFENILGAARRDLSAGTPSPSTSTTARA
jgi:DNA-binding transcriptional MerR regulator